MNRNLYVYGLAILMLTACGGGGGGTSGKNLASNLVGDWYCRNDYNYISKTTYTSDGKYMAYDTPMVPNTRSENLPLTYTGSYVVDGDTLRVTLRSVKSYGEDFNSVTRITKLDKENLVLYRQNSNSSEECFRPFD